MKIRLGTAQFGLYFGIPNIKGLLLETEMRDIFH